MIEPYKTRTNIGVGGGMLLIFGGRFFPFPPELETVGAVLALAGLPLFIWGCSQYAQAKGYHPAVGLLCLLPIIGLIILVCMPDKLKYPPPSHAYDYPPPLPPRR